MRRVALLALLALAALAVPSTASADRSFTQPEAFVTVTVSRDGEVLVREDLTFDYSGVFTGAYRDIPLARDIRVRDVTVGERGTQYTPGGDTTLGSSDAPGRYGFVRLPQGLRIVWHYVQDGGRRTFTLRYRLRGVVIAHDDAVEVAPQVWGDQWKSGLHVLLANVQARWRGSGDARVDRARLARAPPHDPRRARADGDRRRPEQALGHAPRPLSALRARGRRALCEARPRRHPARHDRP